MSTTTTSIATTKPKTHVTLTQKMKARYTGMTTALANIPGPLYCAGKSVTTAELLSEGAAFLKELTDVDDAKAAYKALVAKAKADHPNILLYLDNSQALMKQVLGPTNSALAGMDIKPTTPKKPRKPSIKAAVKSTQIRQNKATMKAQNLAVRQNSSSGQALVDLGTNTVIALQTAGSTSTPVAGSTSSTAPSSTSAPSSSSTPPAASTASGATPAAS